MSGCTCTLISANSHRGPDAEPDDWEQDMHCLVHPGSVDQRTAMIHEWELALGTDRSVTMDVLDDPGSAIRAAVLMMRDAASEYGRAEHNAELVLEVRSLHSRRQYTDVEAHVTIQTCAECRQDWPCATIRLLPELPRSEW